MNGEIGVSSKLNEGSEFWVELTGSLNITTAIEKESKLISVRRQAELLGTDRSTVYYQPRIDPFSLELMHLIDEVYTKTPFMVPGE